MFVLVDPEDKQLDLFSFDLSTAKFLYIDSELLNPVKGNLASMGGSAVASAPEARQPRRSHPGIRMVGICHQGKNRFFK